MLASAAALLRPERDRSGGKSERFGEGKRGCVSFYLLKSRRFSVRDEIRLQRHFRLRNGISSPHRSTNGREARRPVRRRSFRDVGGFSKPRGYCLHSRRLIMTPESRTQSNGWNLIKERSNLELRRLRITNQWNGLLAKVVGAPSLDVFKKTLDNHLSGME